MKPMNRQVRFWTMLLCVLLLCSCEMVSGIEWETGAPGDLLPFPEDETRVFGIVTENETLVWRGDDASVPCRRFVNMRDNYT